MSSSKDRCSVFKPGHIQQVIEGVRRAFADITEDESVSDEGVRWPELKGCLAITTLPRTGGTYLSQELERRFQIGPVREALNTPQIAVFARRLGTRSPSTTLKIVVGRSIDACGWFGFKASPSALLLGEHIGFIDRYWSEMNFMFLLR